MSHKICLFNTHPLLRAALTDLFNELGHEILCETGSELEFQQALGSPAPWDLLLMSLGEAPWKRLKLLRETLIRKPGTRILIYSAHTEPAIVLEALRLGAEGFVSKRSSKHELIQAIQSVLAGGKHYSRDLEITTEEGGPTGSRIVAHKNLSKREYEVLLLLGQGRTNAMIAKRLGVHAKTVSSFRARLLEKLGLGTNADLVLYCMEHSLLPSTSPTLENRPQMRDIQKTPPFHLVQFYRDPRCLASTLAEYVRSGLKHQGAVVLLARKTNTAPLLEELRRSEPELGEALASKRLVLIDAEEALAAVMDSTGPCRARFRTLVGSLVAEKLAHFASVRFYGELVDLLCARERPESAATLESYWNEILAEHPSVALMCGYDVAHLGVADGANPYPEVRCSHSAVIPVETARDFNDYRNVALAMGAHLLGALESGLIP